MLNKRLKSILRLILFLSTVLAIFLIIYVYFNLNSEVINAKAISNNPEANTILDKISNIFFTQAILLIIFFISVMWSIEYLLGWYFIENKNALIDELTEIYNRKGLNDSLKKEITRAKRSKHPISIAMIDIDYFKNYNDKTGHLRGDWLLKAISKILKINIREMDIVGRYGGEEFLLILPETGHDHGVIVCERIRRLIERTRFPSMNFQPGNKVTISIGLATFNKNFDEVDMIHKADSLLYAAKQDNRNNIKHKEYD
jgi:diguanylate cyclase (GGDEF)-like protein